MGYLLHGFPQVFISSAGMLSIDNSGAFCVPCSQYSAKSPMPIDY